MVSSRKSAHKESVETRVALGFLLVCAGAIALALLGHRMTGRAFATWSTIARVAWWLAMAAVLAGSIAMIATFRASENSRQFWIPLGASIAVTAVGFAIAELAVRIVAHGGPNGVRVVNLTLLPYDWPTIADSNRQRLARFRSTNQPYYFAEDTLLGWAIGDDRTSVDGMYHSSDDGIRTARTGEHLRDQRGRRRIALIGDSFTFSMEVPFEEAWSRFLADSLPNDQVLNFGVDGYGVDQILLRFERDATKWAPSVVVFSVIQDDFYRSASVYPFLRGWGYPVSRPRFVLQGDTLALLNSPVLPGDSVFAKPSIFALPLLDHDVFFDETKWRSYALEHSYLARLALTAFAPWPSPKANMSDGAILALNVALLSRFMADARRVGAAPILIYLPSRNDFATREPLLKTRLVPLLRAHGIVMQDLTECLRARVPPSRMFLDGRVHYNALGNAAVATCVQPLMATRAR